LLQIVAYIVKQHFVVWLPAQIEAVYR